MKLYILCLITVTSILFACSNKVQNNTSAQDLVYKENWNSLAEHNEDPDWFRNAKLGIYFHWGVYSVPAFGSEWYPRNMHMEGYAEQKHHLETYGTPAQFGYHDFVPMFKAENFDANEWAALFARAGARFAGPVAEHHDGFSMWDSDITPWNSMDKGPHRDILGELEKAIRSENMKLITTFHHARNLQRYKGKEQDELAREVEYPGWRFNNSHYPLIPGTPQTIDDPELNYLYGNIPEDQWLEEVWFGKLKEVVDKYHPDIIWFDSWLDEIPEQYRQKFCAYYLNQAQKWNKEVVIVRKQDDLPLEVSVDDLEKSRKNRIGEKTWMTDETVSTGSWCYTSNLQIKPAADVLHVLVDIVSKNGVLLLNISPRADGSIPEDQKRVLLSMGAWLEQNGEAIYETRPWYTYGEGPTIEPEGHFDNHEQFLKIKYSADDIRYTTKANTIYATILGKPSDDDLLLKSFSAAEWKNDSKIKKVTFIGIGKDIAFKVSNEGLHLSVSGLEFDDMANVFKIEL